MCDMPRRARGKALPVAQRAWMEKGVENARRKQPDHGKAGRKPRR